MQRLTLMTEVDNPAGFWYAWLCGSLAASGLRFLLNDILETATKRAKRQRDRLAETVSAIAGPGFSVALRGLRALSSRQL